jgi:hypothetical protein
MDNMDAIFNGSRILTYKKYASRENIHGIHICRVAPSISHLTLCRRQFSLLQSYFGRSLMHGA